MKPDTSQDKVLEAINILAENTQAEFSVIHEALQEFAGNVDERFDRMENRMDRIEGRVGMIETQMVTKSYLDDKLADLQGNVVSLIRKEDQKVDRLVTVLNKKGTLTQTDTKDVLSFKVFP